jgi:hypothetical protein
MVVKDTELGTLIRVDLAPHLASQVASVSSVVWVLLVSQDLADERIIKSGLRTRTGIGLEGGASAKEAGSDVEGEAGEDAYTELDGA